MRTVRETAPLRFSMIEGGTHMFFQNHDVIAQESLRDFAGRYL